MDLKEAQLIRRVLDRLTGSAGKSPQQIAHECSITSRRATYLLMCLEKAGLVSIDAAGKVALSEAIAKTVWNHIAKLNNEGTPILFGAMSPWKNQQRAMILFEHDAKNDGKDFLNSIFSEIFGGSRK